MNGFGNCMNKLPIFRYISPSGAKVVFIKKNAAPICNLNLLYKVGSKNDPDGMHGFAHLFEHLMFEGSKNYPKGEFDKVCAQYGGTNNAYTTYDWTMYYMSLPKVHLEIGIKLEADRLYDLSINQESLTNQKSVVTEEIKQVVDNQPYGKWRELQSNIAFDQNSGYQWEVHGSINDVQNATLEKCNFFHNKYYNPENLIIVITGDYEKEEVFELCDKYFNKHISIESEKAEILKIGKAIGTVEMKDNVPYEAAFISYHLPGFMNDELLVSDIIAFITGRGRSSVLYNELQYKAQAVSEVGAFVDRRENASLLTFYAIANKAETTASELEKMLLENIEKAKDVKLLDSMFDKAKNQIKMNLANSLISGFGLSESVALNTAFFDMPDRTYKTFDLYSKITIKDISDMFDKYIIESNKVRTFVKK